MLPPPNNYEAERAVLASVLICPGKLSDVGTMLESGMFYSDRHRVLWEAFTSYRDSGNPMDEILFRDFVRAHRIFEDNEGFTWLCDLLGDWHDYENVRWYAGIVRRDAIARGYIGVGTQIATLASQTDVEGTLPAQVDAMIEAARPNDIGDEKEFKTGLPDYTQESAAELPGVFAGMFKLDAMRGPMRPGQLIIVGASPKVGKTTLALNWAHHAAMNKHRVLFLSHEMPRIELQQKVLAMWTGIPERRMEERRLGATEKSLLAAVGGKMTADAYPLTIAFDPSSLIMRDLAMARSLHRARRLELVIIDYLQLLHAPADDGGRKTENRNNELALISSSLKRLAGELSCPVVCLSQLNRSILTRDDKTPRLSDLRDSGAIEADADAIMFLTCHAEDMQRARGRRMTLTVAAARKYETGDVDIIFDAEISRMTASSPVPVPDSESSDTYEEGRE